MPAHTDISPLDQRLIDELAQREAQGLLRGLRPVSDPGPYVERDGRRLLNGASNDYLGLATHPRLQQAAADAAHRHGVGTGASRLVAGHLDLHRQLEQRFAAFKHAEAALLFPTGFTANLAVLTTLARPGDLILQDKLNHASLIDAAAYSPATTRTFPHRDYAALDRKLARLAADHPDPDTHTFIVTDAVFSMDGDCADLCALLEIADHYRATLVVDEAHATGVLGATGAGLAEAQGVAGQVPITVSTASKALGGLGGIVTASHPVVDALVNHARSFIYTTAVPPPQTAAILAALDVLRDEPERRQRLADITQHVTDTLRHCSSFDTPDSTHPTPILPLVTGSADSARRLADQLEAAGVFAVAIRPPTVAPNAARVRLSLRADFSDDDVGRLSQLISEM